MQLLSLYTRLWLSAGLKTPTQLAGHKNSWTTWKWGDSLDFHAWGVTLKVSWPKGNKGTQWHLAKQTQFHFWCVSRHFYGNQMRFSHYADSKTMQVCWADNKLPRLRQWRTDFPGSWDSQMTDSLMWSIDTVRASNTDTVDWALLPCPLSIKQVSLTGTYRQCKTPSHNLKIAKVS